MFYTFWINIIFQASVRTFRSIAINGYSTEKKVRQSPLLIFQKLWPIFIVSNSEVTYFAKWPILKLIDCGMTYFRTGPFLKWFRSEVTFFRCDRFRSQAFCEVTHFAKCRFFKVNTFRRDRTRSDSFPDWPLFWSDLFFMRLISKWPILQSDFFT